MVLFECFKTIKKARKHGPLYCLRNVPEGELVDIDCILIKRKLPFHSMNFFTVATDLK